MSRLIRALAAGALLATLAACVVTPPGASHPGPSQHEISLRRLRQVDGRIDTLARRVDAHVGRGDYAAAQGDALHHRLDVIRREAHDMAAPHRGGLSSGEQRVLNDELDTAAHAIGE